MVLLAFIYTLVEENRKIIHIDMDAFFASIEQRDNPALRGKPVIVGGPPGSRGVVAAASYEARRFQIRSAMPSTKAARLCPAAIFVPPRFARYREVSERIQRIFREVTDKVEPLALDEAYLDVTENKFQEQSATTLAVYLRSRIKGQLQLTASAGVAPNKFLAKLASEMRKPDGLFTIAPHQIAEIVAALDIEKLWGVGPATAAKLRAKGWNTTADLRALRPEHVCQVVGSQGKFLWHLAHGRDIRAVVTERETKSRGAETTFSSDVVDIEVLSERLTKLVERVTESVTKAALYPSHISIKLRYADFSTITRSLTLKNPTQDRETLAQAALSLLQSGTEAGKRPVRLIGVSLSGFEQPLEEAQLVLPL
jgi:DNA polymerase IV